MFKVSRAVRRKIQVSEKGGKKISKMGGVQPSKLTSSKMIDPNTVTSLSFLEDGQFAKIYKVL